MKTGIGIYGNDHYVSNVIVYSARVGVELSGAANILQGVHTWNCATGNGEGCAGLNPGAPHCRGHLCRRHWHPEPHEPEPLRGLLPRLHGPSAARGGRAADRDLVRLAQGGVAWGVGH